MKIKKPHYYNNRYMMTINKTTFLLIWLDVLFVIISGHIGSYVYRHKMLTYCDYSRAVNCIEAAEAAAEAKFKKKRIKKRPPDPRLHERLAPSALASAKFPSNLRHCIAFTPL